MLRKESRDNELEPNCRNEVRHLALQRLIDILVSGVVLLVASPIFLITVLAMCLFDRGDVLYRQTRVGLRGTSFYILKFRSMRPNRLLLEKGEVAHDDPLVTPIGRWIRRFKVDELPQLFNVFLGDMSLVGPRPRLVEQVASDGEFERRRMQRRPGMTGWAQINGNVELSWGDRILLDVWYVDHWSVWLDFKILALTVAVVLFGPVRNRRAVEEAALYATHLSRSS